MMEKMMIEHKNDLNVFTYGYYSWRYPKNWFSNIKNFFRSIIRAWQRATQGYCGWDVWDLDTYYTELMRDTLIHLAENHFGHPQEFEHEERQEPDGSYTVLKDSWKDWLYETALLLDKSLDRSFDDHQYFPNKYENDYVNVERIVIDLPDGGREWKFSDEDEEIIKKYLEEEKKIAGQRDDCKNQALDRIKIHWWNLWD